MKPYLTALGCTAAILLGTSMPASAQNSAPATKVGTLSCNLSPGIGLIITSARTMVCRFQPTRGPAESYTGSVRRFGLDVGATRQARMVWAVVAPVARYGRGALAGSYVGASAEGTVGVGAGVNALVGGFNNAFSLQPLSVQTQRGLNLAAGVSEFTLSAAR